MSFKSTQAHHSNQVTYVSGRSSEEESLKLGADLNALNKDCETRSLRPSIMTPYR
jgi:hypothetical protein